MFKYAPIIVVLFVGLSFFPKQALAAPDNNQTVDLQTFDALSFDEINRYWNKVVDEYGGYLPEIKKSNFLEFIKGEGTVSVKDWITGMLTYLFYEIVMNGKLLGSLILLTIFSVLLQTIQNAFENHAVSKVAYAIVYLVLIVLALNSFYLAVSYAKEAIDMMGSFMLALLPLMLGLMASFGNVVAVSFFHPIVVFLINASGVLISNIVLPLFFLSALLCIVSTLNEKYNVTQLANLLRNSGLALLGVFLTIFLGVISVQGAASAIQDGVAMKTAKFVTGNFIPVVGRMFTDAADTVLSASLILKNAIGIVGVIIVLGLALFPAVKVFAIAVIYKFAAALLQPIGDGPVIKSMDTISKHILFVFAALLVVTVMFFLAIVIIVASSNVTMMLR
ncbi:stage III sporulation protein AE [Aquibacillus sp. 3ASR75-11]|uniref:Stage III sporulation protein AE n=1 Tax=Terrihalobacillus insolitus TaxID=2950438 RepID=A0A9X4AMH8_9BACI|nr:stage III sporulation protein AE [Terrihalobacillus insolitus]MDC3414426.1 stage III sporulation protein AE [Terrihalobacillus insolitus]MDC3425306.1 stage III sporulation protein AE [Terrihalobacillus insolitus]